MGRRQRRRLDGLNMWQDMGLYWAWRGHGQPTHEAPARSLEYAQITLPAVYQNGPKQGQPVTMRLAVNVLDGKTKTPVHRDELARFERSGCSVVMP